MKNIEIMDSVEGSGLDLEESLAFISFKYTTNVLWGSKWFLIGK